MKQTLTSPKMGYGFFISGSEYPNSGPQLASHLGVCRDLNVTDLMRISLIFKELWAEHLLLNENYV